MATRSAKLYQGEDYSPVIDYTDQVIWEESEFGTRAWQGEGSSSTVVIRDPLGEQGNSLNLPSGLSARSLASKNLFVIDLDDEIMFRGRVGIKNYTRDRQHVERYRQVEVSLHDTHWDLDHIFVHNYARPSETGNARVQGVIASYLSGDPRPTTQLNGSNFLSGSNTITLPAQTFKRTSPVGIIRDTALSENKQFFITGDTIGGGSMFYDGNDSTVYQAGIRISDRPDEIDTDASCTPGLSGATAIATPNGDFEMGDGTNWSGAQVTANIPDSVNDTDWASYDIGAGSGGWIYTGWTALTFLQGVTYTVRFMAKGTGDLRATFGVFTDDDNITDGEQIRDTTGDLFFEGSAWTVNCISWTPSANRTGVRFSMSRGGSSALGTDELTLYQGTLVACAVPGASEVATFPPIWNVGPSSVEDGSEQLCEVVLFYGAGGEQYVSAHDEVVHTQYGHSSETFTDDTIPTEAEAQRRANSILAHRQYEDKTYNITIGPLRDDQVLCVRHGQTIQVKARAIPDADDQFRLMRIVQCRYTTPVVGVWFAHLQLGRPWKLAPYGTGAPLSATSGAASAATPEPIGVEGSSGTDNGELAAADHTHAHGTISNIPAGTAHPAVDVSITDAGGYFTGTEVEAALQELGALGGGSGFAVEEDGVEKGTGITRLDFTTGLNVSVSGSQATVSADAGSAVSWNQDVNEPGTSFANFTTISGTWSSNGTVIQQTAAASTTTRSARYNTILPFGWGVVVEAEIRFPTTGQGTGSNVQAKLVIGDSSTGSQGLAVVLDKGQNNVQLERFGNATLRTFTQAIGLDTWYKVRMVQAGRWASVYVDGTLLGTGMANVDQANADYLLLSTYNSIPDFRNIKLWTLRGGAPA